MNEKEEQEEQTGHQETRVTLVLHEDGEVTVDAQPSPIHMYDILSMLEIAKMSVLRIYFQRVDELKEKKNSP